MKTILSSIILLLIIIFASAAFPQPNSSPPKKIIRIIDPDNGPGTDYTSLQEFAVRERRNLVQLGEIAIAVCRSSNGTSDGPAQFDKWVTDSTHYVMVVAAEGHRATAKWDSTKYRIIEHSTINSECIDVEIDNIVIDGIQMRLKGGGPKNDVIDPEPGIDKLVVKNCFLWLDIQDKSGTALDPGSDVEVINCIIKSSGGGSNAILLKQRGNKMPLANVINNTFIGWQRAIKTESICRVINNIVRGCQNPDVFKAEEDGRFTDDSDFNSVNHIGMTLVNMPRDSSQPPWFNGNLKNADIFIDAENNDYRLKQNVDFINIGVGPEATGFVPDTDINQNSRKGAATDLGAALVERKGK